MIRDFIFRWCAGGLLFGAVLTLGCWIFGEQMSFQHFMICFGIGGLYCELVGGPRGQ